MYIAAETRRREKRMNKFLISLLVLFTSMMFASEADSRRSSEESRRKTHAEFMEEANKRMNTEEYRKAEAARRKYEKMYFPQKQGLPLNHGLPQSSK